MRHFDWETSSDLEGMLESIDYSQIEPQLRRFCVAGARRVLPFPEEPEFAIALDCFVVPQKNKKLPVQGSNLQPVG